jgi:hypothetical protein
LADFLKQFPRKKGEPLFQRPDGKRLSKNTAAPIKHPGEAIQPYGKKPKPQSALMVDPGEFF